MTEGSVGSQKEWAREGKVEATGEKLDMVSIISDFQSSVPDLFSVSKDTLR